MVVVGGSGYRRKDISQLHNLGYIVDADKNISTLTYGTGTITVEGCIFEYWNS